MTFWLLLFKGAKEDQGFGTGLTEGQQRQRERSTTAMEKVFLQIKSIAEGVREQRKIADAKKSMSQSGSSGNIRMKRKGGGNDNDGDNDDVLDDKTGDFARRQAKRRRLAAGDSLKERNGTSIEDAPTLRVRKDSLEKEMEGLREEIKAFEKRLQDLQLEKDRLE